MSGTGDFDANDRTYELTDSMGASQLSYNLTVTQQQIPCGRFNNPASQGEDRILTGSGCYDLSEVPVDFELEDDFEEVVEAR
jgi:hypothetical protein